MTCAAVNSTDVCPTVDEVQRELLALLPLGRAWGGPGGPAPTTTLWKFWRAAADVIQALEQRLCDLRNEFWCQTLDETRAEWLAEYGLPDACDPYPDLCGKVAQPGGQTCAYLQAVAASTGWSIACVGNQNMGAGCAQAGCAQAGTAYGPGYLVFAVSQSLSPAATTLLTPPQAGCYQAGCPNACGIDLTGLDCVLQRIAPAHLKLVYITIA